MIHLRKKKIEIKSPLNGKTVNIEDVPDPVFAEKMMGEGIAIEPTNNLVVSPVNGTIVMIMEGTNHAIGLAMEDGFEILIHIGLDTVELQGNGFELLTTLHAQVKVGDPLISFDRQGLLEKGLNTITMVVVTNPNNKTPIAFYPNKEVLSGKDVIISYK